MEGGLYQQLQGKPLEYTLTILKLKQVLEEYLGISGIPIRDSTIAIQTGRGGRRMFMAMYKTSMLLNRLHKRYR